MLKSPLLSLLKATVHQTHFCILISVFLKKLENCFFEEKKKNSKRKLNQISKFWKMFEISYLKRKIILPYDFIRKLFKYQCKLPYSKRLLHTSKKPDRKRK